MRLAVTGKGGSGKTTLAATLARVFARQGRRVNAVDDDPNPNLAVALGLSEAARVRLQRVPREQIMEERLDAAGNASLHLTRPFQDVVAQYGARGPDDVNVLTMTGLLGAGKGWLCGQHATVRGLIGELGSERPDDVTILDMEASIEHLTRGTVRTADVLVVVGEPYYRSLETMGRIAPLARELGIPLVLGVANKVRSEPDQAAIREYAARRGIEIVGVVPYDESVAEADRHGRALIDHAPAAPAVRAVSELADTLEHRARSIESPGTDVRREGGAR